MRALGAGFGRFLVLTGMVALNALPVEALSVVPYTPPPAQSASPVIVSGYGFDGANALYVQLFNKTDEVVDLTGWQLEYQPTSQENYLPLLAFDGLLRPSNYVLASKTGLLEGADFPYDAPVGGDPLVMSALRLMPPLQYKAEDIKLPTKQELSYWRRNISSSTGNYLSTFASFTPTETDTLYGGGLYDLPSDAGLQVSEILPNPRDCSPVDASIDCSDYVKLYNPTDQPIDLSVFRLRSGYQGQSATSSNTFSLEGVIAPGHYLAVNTASDGHTVSLTNSGGYVWLEDAYGVRLYDQTVQEFPDASSTSHKGQAWAYDVTDGTWKWTSKPTPGDVPSSFPAIIVTETIATTDLTPCQPNQYRSPETNRCRLIPVPTVAGLVACLPGQYRSPETNRCRKIETASNTLTPCGEDQERNPETNRCRKIASAASTLTPCKPNQERNPDTNRCRNKTDVAAVSNAPFPVEPVSQGGTSFTGWGILGGIGAVGLGYGISEWHREILAVFRRGVKYLPFVK